MPGAVGRFGMTTINLRIGKPIGWENGYKFAKVTHWCDDCFMDRAGYKCHAAIGRRDKIYIDDEIKYLRPIQCKDLEQK
jgi:hypothetical protein